MKLAVWWLIPRRGTNEYMLKGPSEKASVVNGKLKQFTEHKYCSEHVLSLTLIKEGQGMKVGHRGKQA